MEERRFLILSVEFQEFLDFETFPITVYLLISFQNQKFIVVGQDLKDAQVKNIPNKINIQRLVLDILNWLVRKGNIDIFSKLLRTI